MVNYIPTTLQMASVHHVTTLQDRWNVPILQVRKAKVPGVEVPYPKSHS